MCSHVLYCIVFFSLTLFLYSVSQVVFVFSDLKILVTDYRLLDTLLIFIVFGWSVIPFMYLISFLFSSHTSAYTKLVIFNYCAGIVGAIADLFITSIQGKGLKQFPLFRRNSSREIGLKNRTLQNCLLRGFWGSFMLVLITILSVTRIIRIMLWFAKQIMTLIFSLTQSSSFRIILHGICRIFIYLFSSWFWD